MIKGMTGFGSTQLFYQSTKILIEIKSLNHRYFDINYFLPIGFSSIENKIRQLIQKQVERGRLSVNIKIMQKPQQAISLNKSVASQYLKNAGILKREFKLKDNLTLSDIIKLPGVMENKEVLVNPEDLWRPLEKSIKKALGGLMHMRNQEGRSLAADVRDKLNRMLLQISKIQKRADAIFKENRKKLTDEEYKSFQKGCDIHEEISRLKHYVVELKKLLQSKVAVGKKMDFIAQETQRETNTIGAKLQDKIVSNAVIALKSKIEKIREQSQNIE